MPARSFVAGEVCARCNSGWMSAIEVAFQDVFTNRHSRPASAADLAATARWFCKTAFVLDSSQNYRSLVPSTLRRQLAVNVPPGVSVHLARYTGSHGPLTWATGAWPIAFAPRSVAEDLRHVAYWGEHVYACAIVVDDIIGLTLFSPPDNWAKPAEPLAVIWPGPPATLDWEALPQLSEAWEPLTVTGQLPTDPPPPDFVFK